ncbi:MAG: helix-turn-helix domain-containing protein [Clostridia bacterium]|nr:helix-turn-helix domain-containing protein [Clostridia bacterium]
MNDIRGKHMELSIDEPDELCRLAHALASPVRIRIMRALGDGSMNVGELAQKLDIPMSSAALAVKTLEEAGLIMTEIQPGTRGAMKICSRKTDTIALSLMPEEGQDENILTLAMPIGGYSIAEGIEPTCGIVGDNAYICDMDDPTGFYVTGRFAAQLIWFRQGALEYRFSCPQMDKMDVEWMEISFEACSEAPMHCDPWKSDIAVSINDKRLGIWTSPCDCGGRHGRITPAWWPELNTQFGFLKTWRVTKEGSFLENERISDVDIDALDLESEAYVSVRIEVPEDARNLGGINLFGENFGDYPQGIVLRIGYHLADMQEDSGG